MLKLFPNNDLTTRKIFVHQLAKTKLGEIIEYLLTEK